MKDILTSVFTIVKLDIAIRKTNLFATFFVKKLGAMWGGGTVSAATTSFASSKTAIVKMGVKVLAMKVVALVIITLVTITLVILVLGRIPIKLGWVVGLRVNIIMGRAIIWAVLAEIL